MTKKNQEPDDTTTDGADDPNDIVVSPEVPATVNSPGPMTRGEFLAAMDAHEAEGDRLEAVMAELGMTSKDVRAMRKAQKAAEAARAQLALLMGEGA